MSTRSNTISQVLSLTGFGFTVPVSTPQLEVTITGITVTIDRSSNNADRLATTLVRLIVNGTQQGDNKGSATGNIPATDQIATYGSATDLFGLTLTPAQVNDPNFGVAFQFQNVSNANGNNPTTLSIDFVSIRVSYTTKDLTVTPVNFTGFEGKKVSNGTQLIWKVAAEVNVKAYEVERSTSGNSGFAKIGSVSATGASSYTFTDVASHSGVVFYRVKNVDNDGTSKYSTVLSFKNGAGSIVFRVLPTVVTGKTSVQHGIVNGNAAILLSTADGRVVRNIRPAAGAVQTDVDLSGLRAGMYLLKFNDGNGTTQTTKLVKQ